MANFTEDLFDAFDEEPGEQNLVPVVTTQEAKNEKKAPLPDQIRLVCNVLIRTIRQ